MKAEELYNLAKEQEGKNPESALILYQQIVDNYDYSIFSDKASFALDRLKPSVVIVGNSLFATTRNIVLAIFFPLVIFTILGPFIGGNFLSFTPFIIFVYGVGILPAILSGIFFSTFSVWFITRKYKNLFSGVIAGLVCGLLSITCITFFQYFTASYVLNGVLSTYLILAFLSCLSGAICGWISLGAIELFSN
ncbi:MAG: hypothetical protein V4660_10135 [Pseudomonadota bacterium]